MKKKNFVVERIKTGAWRENCYVVFNKTRDALIIDPGADAEKIDSFLVKNNLSVSAILNTHGHYDHIGAVEYLQQKYSAKFYLHSSDLKLVQSANLYVTLFEGKGFIKIPEIDIFTDELDSQITINNFTITFLESPGHTNGSICIMIEDVLFTGDTLLKNALGRVDLPGGNEETLKKSLAKTINLPSNIKIFPGHGKETTIDNEKNNIQQYLGN